MLSAEEKCACNNDKCVWDPSESLIKENKNPCGNYDSNGNVKCPYRFYGLCIKPDEEDKLQKGF